MRPVSQVPGRAARAAVRRARAAARADGADATGLARLVELHAISTAGDALVAIGLAGSLFFGVPVGQARTKVALYLAVTMAPFALLAPVIGPALDRVRRGRRAAIGATLVARAVLAALLAEAVAHSDALQLYPAAFGLLVLSKAYGVARSSAVPRLLPPRLSLVRANARISLAGLVLASITAPLGGGLEKLAGPSWPLLLSAATYVSGAVLCFGLAPELDAADPAERPASPAAGARRRRLPTPAILGPLAQTALVGAAAMRWLNGFLTVFVAFLLRDRHGVDGLGSGVSLALVVAAAAIGGLAGTAAGTRLRSRAPAALSLLAVAVALAACVAGLLAYGIASLVALGAATGVTQALSKLALDSLIQRHVPEEVRSSAFSVSESTLQLGWVVGGLVGIVLPLAPAAGLTTAAAVVLLALALMLRSHFHRRAAAVLAED